jgi:hypothetical protein
VESDLGYPLILNASFNREAAKLSFSLILRGESRIYGLCLGVGHTDPETRQRLNDHKHRWTDRHRDKYAYVPPDITADAAHPHDAWIQFCLEARIQHRGVLLPLPPYQLEL